MASNAKTKREKKESLNKNAYSQGRCFHLSLGIPVHITGSTFYHITDAVNQTYLHIHVISKPDFCCFLRHELWFRCHNRASRSRLRQFILRTHSGMFIFHFRKHQHIHESFNKCRLSRPDRSHNTNVDFSIRPRFDIFVYLKSIHQNTPMHELVLLLTDYAGNIPSMYRILLTMYEFSTYGFKKNINLHLLCV